MPGSSRLNPIPTGFLALDQEAGTGGWPAGHIVELVGPARWAAEALAYHAICSALKMGGVAALVLLGRAANQATEVALPVDPSRVPRFAAANVLEALQIVADLGQRGDVSIAVLDGYASVAEGDTEPAGAIGRAMRSAAAAARLSGMAVIAINSPSEAEPDAGGLTQAAKALKEHASLRVYLSDPLPYDGRRTRVEASIVKNRVAGRHGHVTLFFAAPKPEGGP